MCGRYILVTKLEKIVKELNVSILDREYFEEKMPKSNIALGDLAPVISSDKPHEIQFSQFGFTPAWAKKKMYVINARAEGDNNKENEINFVGTKGIIYKPMFRSSIRKRRCLIIADGYIEGPQKEKLKKPYLVFNKNGKAPFTFGGIWDEWIDKDNGELHRSFAILTTAPNEISQKIGHHRAPLIIEENNRSLWLDTSLPLSDVSAMMNISNSSELNAYPISPDIRSPKNKDIDLLKPIGPCVIPNVEYKIVQELELLGMGQTPARQRKLDEDRQMYLFG